MATSRALRSCSEPGCGALSNKGRCPLHQDEEAIRKLVVHDTAPGRSLYFTDAWRQRREDQLSRQPLCVKCGQQAKVADHVVPHRGDVQSFYCGALQSMCPACHSQKTASEAWGQHRRYG